MAGVDNGTIISNYAEIEAAGSSATVHSFETCKDSKGNMVGVQYTLNAPNGGQVALTPLGDMSASSDCPSCCQRLTLSGPIEKVRASYAPSSSTVSAIKYYKGGNSKTYGTLLSSFKEWTFSETSILLGIHGRVN